MVDMRKKCAVHKSWLRRAGIKWDERHVEVVCNACSDESTECAAPMYSLRAARKIQKNYVIAQIPKQAALCPGTTALKARVQLHQEWPPECFQYDDYTSHMRLLGYIGSESKSMITSEQYRLTIPSLWPELLGVSWKELVWKHPVLKSAEKHRYFSTFCRPLLCFHWLP